MSKGYILEIAFAREPSEKRIAASHFKFSTSSNLNLAGNQHQLTLSTATTESRDVTVQTQKQANLVPSVKESHHNGFRIIQAAHFD